MSSKSKAHKSKASSPYGNSSRRGRGKLMLATVVIVLLAAFTWTATYTQNMGESIQNPTPENSIDPVQSASE